MGDSLRVDEDPLRALASTFGAIAQEASAAVQQLQSVLAENGRPWGTDGIGRNFSSTYEPAEHQTLSNLQQVAAGLGEEGGNLLGLLGALRNQDQLGAKAVSEAQPITTSPDAQAPSSTIVPAAATSNIATVQFDAQPQRTTEPIARTDPPLSLRGATPIRDSAYAEPSAADPASRLGMSPSTADGIDAGNPGIGRTLGFAPRSADTSSDSVQPSDVSDAASVSPVGGAAASVSTPANSSLVSGPGREVDAGLRSGSGPTTTPWTRPRPVGKGVSAPAAGGRGGPPRPDARPARPKATKKATVQSDRGSLDTRAMRLARVLARKYGLEVLGFGIPGLDDEAVAEFAAAIDDMLTRHPVLPLTAIAIAELPEDELIRSSADDSDDGISGIQLIFGLVAARDRGVAVQTIAAERRAGIWPVAIESPPVYALTVRELGYAMDAVGGYRARAAVEMSSAESPWESHSAAAAVAAAFTEVELAGDAAGPRAKALYQILLEAAGSAYPPGEIR